MFPDSKIAEQFACGRTKTMAIDKHALAPALYGEVTHLQYYVMVAMTKFIKNILLWDDIKCEPVTRFLAMPVCNSGTAEALLVCWKMNFSLETYHGAI